MRYFVFFLSFLFSFSVWAEDWSNSPEWLALGHYQNKKSSIDSPNFFLSKDGKKNPLSELEASIKLFNSDDNQLKCQFPARYLFLKKHKLIATKFPKCDEFEEFKKDLQAAGVTLLFTDAYMNNPSSLFGHTLLRIDTKRKGTQMLAHGANYGAFTGENPGPLYALFGLTGRYFGGFTKGVPVRLAMGGRDLENGTVELARRDTCEKSSHPQEGVADVIAALLDDIQANIYAKALKFRDESIRKVDTWEEFKTEITKGGFLLCHWDGTPETEEKIKEETKATIRCIPVDSAVCVEEGKCIYSGKPSSQRVLFAISY